MNALERFSVLAPFRVRNYRFQWPADLFTSWAFEMETLILGWYVLAATGSVLLLTIFASLTYIGTLIAPLLGVLGDRIGHRNLLVAMRAIYTLLSAMLMMLALAGMLRPVHVFVIAMLTGLVRPSDIGVRGAVVASIVPHELLLGAMSISRTTMDTARIAGALSGAGLFAALGIGPAYVAIVILYCLSTLLTLCVVLPSRPQPVDESGSGASRKSPLRDLKEGVTYVWTSPLMQAAMWVAFLANMTAFPLSNGLLPYIAKEVYGTDQTGLGYLSASFAIGSLIASLLVSMTRGVPVARLMIVGTGMWYCMLLAFAQVHTVPFAIAFLLLAGFAQSLSMISVLVLLLRTASEHFRGRVMGVRMLAIYSLPLGLLAAGSLIERIGFVVTATSFAIVGLVLIGAIALRWRADLWYIDAPANVR
ncbi:MAG: MFS transporter [Proteobacteria bacterium]|nr:MFS transporter [Pseudomonadota bacterium]